MKMEKPLEAVGISLNGDTRSLKILVLSHYFWPESFRINQIVSDMTNSGFDVTVITGYPNYPDGKVFAGYNMYSISNERHHDGYNIIRVPIVPRGTGRSIRLILNYLSFTLLSGLIGTWMLRRSKFDIIFVYATTPVIQGYAALWLRAVCGGKVVLWVQDLWPQALVATGHMREGRLLRLIAKAINLLYRNVDLILAQSHAFVPTIEGAADSTPVRYFPNPGESPSAETSSSRKMLPVDKFNVVFGGNFGKAQALGSVVDAAVLLRNDEHVHITLYGSGSMSKEITDRIAADKLTNLTLGGRLAPSEIGSAYSEASALLVTLVNDELLAQTVPSKLQSYLASGRPVVAAVEGEAARIVLEAGAGVSCRAEDPADLARAIRQLAYADGETLARMGDSGRAYFDRHFEPQTLTSQLIQCFETVAFGKPKPN